MASKREVTIMASHLINGAEVIQYEGQTVINVEETHWDATEAAEHMGEYLSVCGYFAEPINSVLIGVWER